jgi:hypothetical protein
MSKVRNITRFTLKTFTMAAEWNIYGRVARVGSRKSVWVFNTSGKKLRWIRLGCRYESGGKIASSECGLRHQSILFSDKLDADMRKREEIC